jgi:hypothetical protein
MRSALRQPGREGVKRMDELLEARRQAEAAVSDMTDPELRAAGFKVILQHLLSLGGSVRAEGPSARAPKAGKGTVASDAKPARAKLPKSASERILTLRDEGFLDPGRRIGEIRDELQAHGWMYALTALSGTLMKLVRNRELRRVHSNEGKKKAFKYFKP